MSTVFLYNPVLLKVPPSFADNGKIMMPLKTCCLDMVTRVKSSFVHRLRKVKGPFKFKNLCQPRNCPLSLKSNPSFLNNKESTFSSRMSTNHSLKLELKRRRNRRSKHYFHLADKTTTRIKSSINKKQRYRSTALFWSVWMGLEIIRLK